MLARRQAIINRLSTKEGKLLPRTISEEANRTTQANVTEFYHTAVTCGSTYISFAERLTGLLQQNRVQDAMDLVYDCAIARIYHQIGPHQQYNQPHEEAIMLMLNLHSVLRELGNAANGETVNYYEDGRIWTFALEKDGSRIEVKSRSVRQVSGGKRKPRTRKTKKTRKSKK
jgi:hypothetical protein